MRKILWIVGVVLLLAIVTPVVLVATLPTAKVTITAIGPTGKNTMCTNAFDEVSNGQEWLFGITNVGRAAADWAAAIHSRRLDENETFSLPIVGYERRGVLQRGEGMVTNLMVAAG